VFARAAGIKSSVSLARQNPLQVGEKTHYKRSQSDGDHSSHSNKSAIQRRNVEKGEFLSEKEPSR